MSYHTKNEWGHFDFQEAHIGNIQITGSMFHLVLDNVKILPENSCNHDIRTMRCNELLLKIADPQILEVVEEGYRQYDANGVLRQEIADRVVEPEEYSKVWEVLLDGEVYAMQKEGGVYLFVADGTNERTYMVRTAGSGDSEDWERFLNL